MGYWQERQEAMYKAGEMQVNKILHAPGKSL